MSVPNNRDLKYMKQKQKQTNRSQKPKKKTLYNNGRIKFLM